MKGILSGCQAEPSFGPTSQRFVPIPLSASSITYSFSAIHGPADTSGPGVGGSKVAVGGADVALASGVGVLVEDVVGSAGGGVCFAEAPFVGTKVSVGTSVALAEQAANNSSGNSSRVGTNLLAPTGNRNVLVFRFLAI